jgi:hypothetical protein
MQPRAQALGKLGNEQAPRGRKNSPHANPELSNSDMKLRRSEKLLYDFSACSSTRITASTLASSTIGARCRPAKTLASFA